MAMETYLLLITQGIFAIFVLLGYAKLYQKIVQNDKNQQEIKTRLTWSRKRELTTLKKLKK